MNNPPTAAQFLETGRGLQERHTEGTNKDNAIQAYVKAYDKATQVRDEITAERARIHLSNLGRNTQGFPAQGAVQNWDILPSLTQPTQQSAPAFQM